MRSLKENEAEQQRGKQKEQTEKQSVVSFRFVRFLEKEIHVFIQFVGERTKGKVFLDVNSTLIAESLGKSSIVDESFHSIREIFDQRFVTKETGLTVNDRFQWTSGRRADHRPSGLHRFQWNDAEVFEARRVKNTIGFG